MAPRSHRLWLSTQERGEGPNWRLRTIRAALGALNFNENILRHGIQREVFVSKLAANAFEVLRSGKVKPDISGLLSVAKFPTSHVIAGWSRARSEVRSTIAPGRET